MSETINKVKQTVMQAVTNKKFLLILFLLVLFIALAFWVYTTYIAPKLNPEYKDNKEFISDNSGDEDAVTDANIYAFFTDWCPHCKTNIIATDSGWKKTKEKYNGQKVNGITVTFVEVNGEKEEGTLQSFESSHSVNITGFPTIYLVKGNNVIEFDSDITEDNLSKFLNTAL